MNLGELEFELNKILNHALASGQFSKLKSSNDIARFVIEYLSKVK